MVLLLAACNSRPAPNTAPAEPTISTPQPAASDPTQAADATLQIEKSTEPPVGFADPAAYSWNLVSDGFAQPLLVTHAGDGSGRLFVVEQQGMIIVLENGQRLATPFLDIRYEVGSDGNEQGLLGLAFHPDFENNGYFYVNYTGLGGNTVISRFQVSADGTVADANSEMPILYIAQPYSNHNGGHLEFGPDGYLYIGSGDGGSGGDPQGNGQSRETLLGKLLRLDVNVDGPYGIPADNPFVSGGGLDEIWAYGLRNPWRFSFDRATGDLYIADVGQGEWEEVHVLPAGTGKGANLGWNYYEGTHAYEGTPPGEQAFEFPVVEYTHGQRCSITGGYVYRGAALPAWNGIYFFGDFCSGEVLGLYQAADGQWNNQVLWDSGALITSFGQDEAGELYLVDRNGGIYQLQANP
ncbi:MAG: PQQ-dependent sugar dehydrogenase [Anaerolineales bacterium]|nr:PQQ-dependent sugar dehydrogenase [Anaerolineales bacterium]